MTRNRLVYCMLLAATIVAGLASRRYAELLPPILQKNAGDALWALAVYLFLGILFPRWSTAPLAAAAMAISILVEVSQLYHAPWIDSIRETRIGALLLGWGFLWGDLLCYAFGVGIGALAENVLITRRLLPATGQGMSNPVEGEPHDGPFRDDREPPDFSGRRHAGRACPRRTGSIRR